ncbi:YhjD/YihY/BrkB family envelope integrity protein [Oceanivirga salmonicida]|uniref:YhjD/YihY/BrkB family envelope integrity protein n=2 Tax=Oceanivirga salmonicida TaxID=1769291 RepID=UPI0012E12CB7|nr:YhjD/YihY/BrkB family envelope integrity protein [Oceanivirga salmonicida]
MNRLNEKNIKNILKIIFNNFMKTDIVMLANDLTYVSLLSIFPLIAIVLGFTKGFGLDVYLLNKLTTYIPASETQLGFILDTTRKLVNSMNSSLLSGLGIIIIFWTVISLLSKIEVSFNIIWHAKKKENFGRSAMNYIAIVILIPIILVLLLATNDKITQLTFNLYYLSFATVKIVKIIKLIVLILFFAIMYQRIPSTNVSIKSSIISSIIVIILLIILSTFYSIVQGSISYYNAIYGSLAFVPLFLLWIKYFWIIVLAGAQITYSLDTNYDLKEDNLSVSYKKTISVYVLYKIIKRFMNNEENYTLEKLAKEINIKNYIVRIAIDILEELGYIICSVKNENNLVIQINKNPDLLILEDFIKEFEKQGEKDIAIFINNEKTEEYMKFENLIYPNNEKLIKDIL